MKYILPFENEEELLPFENEEELLPSDQTSVKSATSETATVGKETQPEKKSSIMKTVIPLLAIILLVILFWRWKK